jgi:hypothetical protein
LERAKQYFESGEGHEAEMDYRNVLRIQPVKPLAIRRLGMIYQDQIKGGLGFSIPAQNDRIGTRDSGDPLDVSPGVPVGPSAQRGSGRGDVYIGKATWQ